MLQQQQNSQKRLHSARVNSAFVIKNNQAYNVSKNTFFITQQRRTEELIEKAVQSECPTFFQYSQRPKTPLKMEFKDHTRAQASVASLDYQRFIKKRKSLKDEAQVKMEAYLNQSAKVERRYLKLYKRQDKEFFKKSRKQSLQQLPKDSRNMPEYQLIMQVNQQQSKKANQSKLKEKRRQEILQEEKEEKQYMKDLLDKYMGEEQKYFDKLNYIGEAGAQRFESSVKLYRKYDYHYANTPKLEYVQKKKDLQLEAQQDCLDPNSNQFLIDVEQQLQDRLVSTKRILKTPFGSSQQIGSYQNVHVPMNSPQLMRENTFTSCFNQKEEPSLEISDKIRLPLAYDSDLIRWFKINISLNNKTEVIFKILSNLEYLKLKDSSGQSLLHIAVLKNWNGLAKFFIKKGLSFDERDNVGRTPRDIALKFNNQKLIEFEHNYIQNPK